MPQFTSQSNASLGTTVAPTVQATVTDNLAIEIDESIPAAQPGSLTTRTDTTHGTLTMTNAGHGIQTGDRVDLYWSGGQTYNVTVGTVAGTSVPITLSTGTLPALNSAVTVGIAKQVDIALTGNNLSALLFTAPVQGYFVMATSAPADENAQLVAAGGAYTWYTGSGITNPLAGVTIASIWLSHSDTTQANNLKAAALAH